MKISQSQNFNNSNSLNYDTKWQFCSWWHQIDEMVKCCPEDILEIGVGNKFVYNYLLKMGMKIFSLDINKDLNPNIVATVTNLPFKNNSFDVVGCFEVLEHLPFEDFTKCLGELHRIARCKVIISLPEANKYFVLNLSIPFYGIVRRIFTHNLSLKKNVKICKEHFWEIGLRGYPLSKVVKNISEAGFIIEKNYRVFENPYHRFFVLKK